MSKAKHMDARQTQIRQIATCGLLSLRGTPAVMALALRSIGLAVPELRKISRGEAGRGETSSRPIRGSGPEDRVIGAGDTDLGAPCACWMSPDEILLVLPLQDLALAQSKLADALRDQHHLLHDITQGRAIFQLRGPRLREVLAKAMPVDLDPSAFGVDDIRRTRAGQVNATFWLNAENDAVVISARSVGNYVEALLRMLSRPEAEIGWFDEIKGPSSAG